MVFSFLVVLFFIFSPINTSGADLCFGEAAKIYGINPKLLEAISKVESNHNNNAINWNSNGTYDYCHMQINSAWYQSLGHDKWMSIADPCSCTLVGAEILEKCIDRYGYTWEAVGCYNANSKGKRVVYTQKVYKALSKIGGQ